MSLHYAKLSLLVVNHVGQKVYKRNFRQSSAAERYNAKYGPLYMPCVIVARRGSSSYEVADSSGKILGVFSAADLRPGDDEKPKPVVAAYGSSSGIHKHNGVIVRPRAAVHSCA